MHSLSTSGKKKIAGVIDKESASLGSVIDYNDDLVMENLGDVRLGEKLSLSLFDFGGQSVFNVIHHFFLTPYSLYLVVFNMEWLWSKASTETRNQCLAHLHFWVKSIIVHASNEQEKTVAPIAFVGTHGDIVRDPTEHETISQLLYDEFKCSVVFKFMISNDSYEARQGAVGGALSFMMGAQRPATRSLHFYPLNNKHSQRDVNTISLRRVIEDKLMQAPFVMEQKSLTWFRYLDCIKVVRCFK
jgi:hypothetical protein